MESTLEKPWFNSYEKGVPHTIQYPEIPLHTFLEDSAQKYGNQTAIHFILKYLLHGRITIGGHLTYRQLLNKVNRFASALQSMGVKKGDRVAVMLPNSPQFVIAFFAAAKIGAIVVNTNPVYVEREIRHQLADSGAETIVIWNNAYPRLKKVQAETSIKNVIVSYIYDFVPFPFNLLVKSAQQKEHDWYEVTPGDSVHLMTELIDRASPNPKPVEVSPGDVALFQYTGGTTGVPKGAMLTHRNLVANVLQVSKWLTDVQFGKEKLMAAIPFFHVYGMTVAMIFAVYGGAEIFIVPNPRDITFIMDVIQKERCTLFPGVPAMYISIINHKRINEYDLKSIKACISGAAPLPMEVQVRFGEITGGRLREGYGLTEAAPVTHCNPIYGEARSGSIGVPFPDVEARIVDVEKGTPDMPLGEEGELILRGPQIMKGYWDRPDETALTIRDGWLYTGDIAKMDEQGYFYIVDRKKDMIIASGYKIIPREVEEVLFTHPKVLEAAVAGVPDPKRGETVKAYVVVKDGETCTEQEIIDFCKANMAPYKYPRIVEFRQELPKTITGKVLRRMLVEEEKKKLARG